MRYAKQISTGLMIESQGGGNPDNPMHLSIMVQYAVGAGTVRTQNIRLCLTLKLLLMMRLIR